MESTFACENATLSVCELAKRLQHTATSQVIQRHKAPSNLDSIKTNQIIIKARRKSLPMSSICQFFTLLILNTILSHLNKLDYVTITSGITTHQFITSHFVTSALPNIIFADAIECAQDGDCGNVQKICHENKCICNRDRPIEHQDSCLQSSLLNEPCAVNEQCLGNSYCLEGICSCATDAISFFNPSTKIYYCHPKRQLNEECNYDSQCPFNSYCSNNKFGCLCQNGFASALIKNATEKESLQCLPITCSDSSSCESEYHLCDDNKCKCLATHFDPTTAKCYKFGSTGGKPADELRDSGSNLTSVVGNDTNFYSIMKDLTENSDRMWLVLIILISLSILVFALIFFLIRKYYLGYCWTAHKKEYEPNNKNQPKNGYFNKNSINNKSFRLKNGENDDDDVGEVDGSADRSSLVSDKKDTIANRASVMTSKDKHNRSYVKVNIDDNQHDNSDSLVDNRQYYQHQVVSPLKTSTSTPV